MTLIQVEILHFSEVPNGHHQVLKKEASPELFTESYQTWVDPFGTAEK